MKKLLTAAALAAMATGASAEDVKLQLKWVTQAQFAGYYVAQAKGYYEEEGLNVTILPGGPDIAPTQVMAGGGADVMVDWMPSALAAREKGLPLVNIAQPFASSGMMLTCMADSGIKEPKDFADKTLGVWFGGRGDGAEAGVQRRSAAAETGGLHLDHDLQRILAGDRRWDHAGAAGDVQVSGHGRGDAGRRALCA